MSEDMNHPFCQRWIRSLACDIMQHSETQVRKDIAFQTEVVHLSAIFHRELA